MVALASSASSLGSSPCFLGQKLISNNTTSSPPAPSCVTFLSPRVAASYTSAEKASSNMASPASFYEVLGIPRAATSQEIKAAYRRLARVCHPDAVATDRKDTSSNEFMKIHAAYSTLSDPQKRTDYDRELFRQQRLYRSPSSDSASSYAAAPAAFPGFTRRSWETHQCW